MSFTIFCCRLLSVQEVASSARAALKASYLIVLAISRVRFSWYILSRASSPTCRWYNCTVAQLGEYFTDYRYFSGPGRAMGPVCVVLCESGQLTFELSDLSRRYVACWFFLTLSGSSSKVKVIGQSQSSRSEEENVVKVVGATSSEGFLVEFLKCL